MLNSKIQLPSFDRWKASAAATTDPPLPLLLSSFDLSGCIYSRFFCLFGANHKYGLVSCDKWWLSICHNICSECFHRIKWNEGPLLRKLLLIFCYPVAASGAFDSHAVSCSLVKRISIASVQVDSKKRCIGISKLLKFSAMFFNCPQYTKQNWCITVGTVTRTAGILIYSRLKSLAVNLSRQGNFGCMLAWLGLSTLTCSKHCIGDEFPRSGPWCLCESLFTHGWIFLLVPAQADPGSPDKGPLNGHVWVHLNSSASWLLQMWEWDGNGTDLLWMERKFYTVSQK